MKNLLKFLVIPLIILISSIYAPKALATTGAFTVTGSMVNFMGKSSALLPNGKVLMFEEGRSAELYDPSAGMFSISSSTTINQGEKTATLLQDGRVLVLGGIDDQSHINTIAEIYDPSTDVFTQTGSLNIARSGYTATLLENGKVLVIGGEGTAQAELYDPSTGMFSLTGIMNYPRQLATATKLPNGKVFIIGGDASFDDGMIAEIYDPNTEIFSIGATIPHVITNQPLDLGNYEPYHHTATLLPNGKVLIAGADNVGATNLAFLYDPSSDVFTQIQSMNVARADDTATLLENGKVLIAGGYNPSAVLSSAELYDPSTGQFTFTGPMNYPRAVHSATLLSDGRVLVAGGVSDLNFDTQDTAELYDPNATANSAPVVGQVTAPTAPVQVNTIISASAPFTDQDTGDTHTASWNWGDGNTTTGTVTESNGSGSVSDTHTYTQAGVYTITLTVTDNHGASDTSQFQYVVVYDPSAGFLTGSGKYTSQAGWDMQNTNATGDVIFGISAKYTGSNTTPTGTTKLTFKVGNLTLSSTSYQWLVVSGAKATLKGNGTVNASGNYTFFLSGIDGSQTGGPNLIRFQIKDSSNNVIYDTQPGAADTADPTTTVSNGTIKVH